MKCIKASLVTFISWCFALLCVIKVKFSCILAQCTSCFYLYCFLFGLAGLTSDSISNCGTWCYFINALQIIDFMFATCTSLCSNTEHLLGPFGYCRTKRYWAENQQRENSSKTTQKLISLLTGSSFCPKAM